MKILVTGGAGYIGSHTVHLLAKTGYEVVVIDNLVYGHKEAIIDESVELVVGDIGDKNLVSSLFSKHSFEAVIHFAAYAYVGESVEAPLKYYQNNVAKPLVLLEQMKEHGCKKFIFSSTCATYGNPDKLPISENTAQNPINPYGKSKLMLEKILDDCDTAWGLKSVCLRYFNACGASSDGAIGESHDPETHLIPLILEVALGERDAITIYGNDYDTIDGTCVRDYIHVEDLATAHCSALVFLKNKQESLACNLGVGSGFTVKEVIQKVEEVTQSKIAIKIGGRRDGDPAELIADASLAREKLHWEPEWKDVSHAIKHAWQWLTGVNKGKF